MPAPHRMRLLFSQPSQTPTVDINNTLVGPFVFPTNASAPLPSPYTEPGAVSSLTFVDTTNKYTIAANKLHSSGAASALSDPRTVVLPLGARQPGRVLLFSVKSASWAAGLANSSSPDSIRGGLQGGTNNIGFREGPGNMGSVIVTDSTLEYQIAIVEDAVGAYAYIKGGAWASWTFLGPLDFYDSSAFNAQNVVSLLLENGANAHDFTNIEVREVAGRWAKRFGLADYVSYRPTDGYYGTVLPLTRAGGANGCIRCTWDIDTGATAAVVEYWFRMSDASNYWVARMTQSTSTLAIIKVVSGVETPVQSTSLTVTAEKRYKLAVRWDAGSIAAWCRGSNVPAANVVITATAQAFNQSATGEYIPPGVQATPSHLAIWDTLLHFTSVPTRTGKTSLNIFPMGDSKTVGATPHDVPPVGTTGGGYPWRLMEILTNTRDAGAHELPPRVAQGGQDSQQLLALLNSTITVAPYSTGPAPHYITFNSGTNDLGQISSELGTPTWDQATWLSYYGGCLDLMHAQWPSAIIFCARPQSQNHDATTNNLLNDTYIPLALSTRPWARLGPDERVVLYDAAAVPPANPWDTYTSDRSHPNHAGYMLMAEAWAAYILAYMASQGLA